MYPEGTSLTPATASTIDSLLAQINNVVITLSPFHEGGEFKVRVRRPSVMKMAADGKIPNTLLGTATSLFSTGKGFDADNPDTLKQMYEFSVTVARASMVEPTYDQLTEAGIQLTDQQLSQLLNYSQTGVDPLHSFRSEREGAGGNSNVQDLRSASLSSIRT